MEMWVDPGGGVPPHIHPAMEERFEVLAGRPSFLAGKRWMMAGPGETVVVPAGTRHAFRNNGDEVAHVVCHARPPSTLQEFLEDAAALGRTGKLTSQGLPKSWSALLQAAVMIQAYRDMAVLLFPPAPPPVVQRAGVPGARAAGGAAGLPGRAHRALSGDDPCAGARYRLGVLRAERVVAALAGEYGVDARRRNRDAGARPAGRRRRPSSDRPTASAPRAPSATRAPSRSGGTRGGGAARAPGRRCAGARPGPRAWRAGR